MRKKYAIYGCKYGVLIPIKSNQNVHIYYKYIDNRSLWACVWQYKLLGLPMKVTGMVCKKAKGLQMLTFSASMVELILSRDNCDHGQWTGFKKIYR